MTTMREGKTMSDALDEQEFFDLMQAYRHAPVFDQAATMEAYEAVKTYLRTELVEPLNTARGFIAEHVGVEPEIQSDPVETY